MLNKQEIIDYYNNLCKLAMKKLSRNEYRNTNSAYSSSLIEKLWGNWSNFIKEADTVLLVNRIEKTKIITKNIDKIVISYVHDGSNVNKDAFYTLQKYCNYNNAELVILWGKNVKKNLNFSEDVFNLISPYLYTDIRFEKDETCIAKDFLIPATQKNPLLNIEKISTNIKTIVIGSTKQYLKMLPYKQYTNYRVACSTGTISEIEYNNTVAGHIDNQNHTFGGILLEYSPVQKRHIVRTLIYANNCICDLNMKYTKNKVITLNSIPGIVLGDLHFPEEDNKAILETVSFMKKMKPEVCMLHDVADWHSICHHEANQFLNKLTNSTHDTYSLQNELNAVQYKLNSLTSIFPNIKFKIVKSNHDDFITKWLNTGEFAKDSKNARIGAELFIKYLDGKNILSDVVTKNVEFLTTNSNFKICGFQLGEHGDWGLSGAKGSAKIFNQTFEKTICGHTHSPEITEKTTIVGTLSKLKMSYNQKGMTKWAHCNCIIHENGTSQLIFI